MTTSCGEKSRESERNWAKQVKKQEARLAGIEQLECMGEVQLWRMLTCWEVTQGDIFLEPDVCGFLHLRAIS